MLGISITRCVGDGTMLEANSSSKIRYYGRVGFADPKNPEFSWPMSGFTFAFHGSQTVFGRFRFPDDGGKLRVVIDGQTRDIEEAKGKQTMKQYKLAENLESNKSYTAQVFKTSEDFFIGTDKDPALFSFTFGGLELDAGDFDPAPKALSRRLEFIGDSDTAGWCVKGHPGGSHTPIPHIEDAYVTWAQKLARHLEAEVMVEAVSGSGVTNQALPIRDVIDLAGSFYKKSQVWNYSQWTPDAVLLLIGPNDQGSPDLEKDYLKLMKMVAQNYKDASTPPKIIHVCGGSGNGMSVCPQIQKVNKYFNEQGAFGTGLRGYFTSITQDHWNMINANNGTSAYNGCETHYNEKGHSVLAADIIPQVQQIMGWTHTTSSPTPTTSSFVV
jgi:hypothetical protein